MGSPDPAADRRRVGISLILEQRLPCDDPHMERTLLVVDDSPLLARDSVTVGQLRLGLVALGGVLGVLAIGLATTVGPLDVTQLGIYVAIGWSFLAAGTAAWVRRPGNPFGPLMTVTGLVYLSRDVMWWHAPVGVHLNEFLLGVFLALIAHELVVYPDGRLRSRIDVLLVCSAYALAVGGYVLGKLFDDPHLRGCEDCSRNLLLVYGDKTVSSIANDSSNVLAV